MRKKLIAAIVLFTGFGRGLRAEAPGVRLDDLPHLVRENNERVQAARLFVEATRRETGFLKRAFLPEVEAEAGHESFRTGTEDRRSEPFGTVGAHWNVYRSGRDRLEDQRRGAAVQAAQAELEEVIRSELKEARETFWVLTFQREMARVVEDALERNGSFLKAAERKIQSGLSTATDRLEFEIQRRELEQDWVRLKTEGARAEKTLALLTAEPGAIETPADIPHDHDDALLSAPFDSGAHPSVHALEAARAAETLAARQSRRAWAPSVDLYSNYSLYTFREREFDERSDRDETVAGGKVSLPIFNGLESRAGSRASALRAESYAKRTGQTRRALQLEVETAQETLKRIHDLVHSAEENVRLGQRYLDSTLTEYARGVKNSPDLAGAVQILVDVKRRHADLRLDYQLAKAGLLALLGQ